MLLNHVKCEIISPKKSKPNIYERFSEGEAFKGSNFWNETESMKLEIILYHDDFNVVNPLGNKTSKYKVSACYFVLGNLPASKIQISSHTHSSCKLSSSTAYWQVWI